MKGAAFAITIRPKYGVSVPDVIFFQRLFIKYGIGKIITEKTGTKSHIHASLYTKKPYTVSNVNNMIRRPMDVHFKKTQNIIGKGGYNFRRIFNAEWDTKYLCKGDDTVTFYEEYPEDPSSYYFPEVKKEDRKAKSNILDKIKKEWFNTYAEEPRGVKNMMKLIKRIIRGGIIKPRRNESEVRALVWNAVCYITSRFDGVSPPDKSEYYHTFYAPPQLPLVSIEVAKKRSGWSRVDVWSRKHPKKNIHKLH